MATVPIEEVREVAYRNRPPLLEDASIRGPTRTPVRDAMLTLEERDAIEADFRWYRYSKFALPWLILMLLLAITVFCLTAWHQVGSYKRFNAAEADSNGRAGVPRIYVTKAEREADEESGLPKELRNVRIATVWVGAVGIVLIFLVLLAKPRPGPRKALNFILALFLIAMIVLAAIGFAWGIDRVHDGRQCPFDYERTYEKCLSREGVSIVAIAAEACIFSFGIFALILLIIYTKDGDWRLDRTGWRERERDAQTEVITQRDPKHTSLLFIRNVRIGLLSLLLLLTLAAIIVLTIMIVVIHEDRNVEYPLAPYRGTTFRGRDLNYQYGWPTRNTQMRYAYTGIAIILLLLNLIPFTHRLIAYAFGFAYLVLSAYGFVVFAFDVDQFHAADSLPCPEGISCTKSPFIAEVILEFLLALFLLIYFLYEILAKAFTKSKWSRRSYAPHEIKKHDRALDSLRPVRDEVTGRVMPAKEYVYRWRFIAGSPAEADYIPPVSQPLFAAPGYDAPAGFLPAAPVIM